MGIMLTRTIELLIFPPGITLLLLAIGLILLRRRQKIGMILLSGGIFLFYLSSIPITAQAILWSLERYPALSIQDLQPPKAGAIVALGGGRRYDAPEYQGDSLSSQTLERLHYAVRLHRLTGLPILLSGGTPLAQRLDEASLMKETLIKDFQISKLWTEGQSRTTYENALYSKELLEKEGIDHIYLVTHAWHMPRAVESFQKLGLKVIAAPTGFTTRGPLERGLYAWLPRAGAVEDLQRALHEILGRIWYWLFHH